MNAACRHARWPPSTSMRVAPGIAAAIARCRSGCTARSLVVQHDRRRDVDLADPAARVVRAQRLARLDDHAPVVPAQLGRDPRGRRCARRGRTGATGTDGANAASRAAPRRAEHPRLVREPGGVNRDEPGRRRAEHEPGDEVAVPAPQQLRDRSAHRVSDRDHRPGVELDERRGAVVGAVREAEDAPRPQAARVAAQVGRDDPEMVAERRRTTWNQFRPPLATQPCSSSSVGAPGGPAISRTNVVPRRGSSSWRPGGSVGLGHGGPVRDAVDAVGELDEVAPARRCRRSSSTAAHLGEHGRAFGMRAAPRRGSPTRCAVRPVRA